MLCQKNPTLRNSQGSAVSLEVLRELRPHAKTVSLEERQRRKRKARRLNNNPTLDEVISKFWYLVDKLPGNGCWIFRGSIDENGYGKITLNKKVLLAHKFSWFVRHGKWPSKPYLCHSCDNPSCVRISHLFEGTPTDNNRDAIKKQRVQHWGRPKILPDMVRKIRSLYTSGEFTYKSLGEHLGLPLSQIQSALNKWKTLEKYHGKIARL